MRGLFKHIAYSLIVLLFNSCQVEEAGVSDGKFVIVTTTGMIADAVTNIAGKHAEVIALMGSGVDPHLYKPTHGDIEKITNADLILYNGLHLEGKMGEVLHKASRIKRVEAISNRIKKDQLRKIEGFNDLYDPHIWFDVSLWSEAVSSIAKHLQEIDTVNATSYKRNSELYLTRLDSLHRAVRQAMTTIPVPQRVLITAHDAFGYFGDAYGVDVRGLQGISTMSEFGLRDVTELVNFIVSRKIKAIFVESSVSNRSIQAVIEGCKEKGWNVVVGGTLYSDAMGSAGTKEGTYIGMVNANVQTIISSLK